MRFQFGDFLVDEETRQLRRGALAVHLSPKAFDLLTALIRARPRALSKADLHECLWPRSFVSDASLATLAAEIRGALDERARAPGFLRTVHRHGYAFSGTGLELPERTPPLPPAAAIYWLLGPLRQIPLASHENIVGRDPHAQVWLDSPSVSRRHACLTVDGERVTVEDLSSKNGTHVKGRAITSPTALVDGDEIRFGDVSVTFRVWASDASTRTNAGS